MNRHTDIVIQSILLKITDFIIPGISTCNSNVDLALGMITMIYIQIYVLTVYRILISFIENITFFTLCNINRKFTYLCVINPNGV